MRVSVDRQIAALVSVLTLSALGCVAPGSLENKSDFIGSGTPATPATPRSGTGAIGGGGTTAAAGTGTGAAGQRGAGSGGSASGGSASGGSGSGANCGACQIIATKCAGCHTAAGISGGLDLSTPGFANKLKGMMSASSLCMGKTLINTTAPGSSLLVTKLGPQFDCGMRMPPGPPLPDAEITCITQWLANPVCP